MGLLTGIFGDAIKPITDLASEAIKDKDKQAQMKVDLQRAVLEAEDKAEQRLHEQMTAQIEVNKVEAGSSNMFVAGWRPAVGWVSVVALAYSVILNPIASWIARVLWEYQGNFPTLDQDSFMFLLAGMLGFGGLRSWEKISGVKEKEPEPSPPAAPAKLPTGYSSMGIPDYTELPEDAPWKK